MLSNRIEAYRNELGSLALESSRTADEQSAQYQKQLEEDKQLTQIYKQGNALLASEKTPNEKILVENMPPKSAKPLVLLQTMGEVKPSDKSEIYSALQKAFNLSRGMLVTSEEARVRGLREQAAVNTGLVKASDDTQVQLERADFLLTLKIAHAVSGGFRVEVTLQNSTSGATLGSIRFYAEDLAELYRLSERVPGAILG
jgi:hypothetical protein